MNVFDNFDKYLKCLFIMDVINKTKCLNSLEMNNFMYLLIRLT